MFKAIIRWLKAVFGLRTRVVKKYPQIMFGISPNGADVESIDIEHKKVIISTRDRTPLSAHKVSTMKQLIDIVHDEDIDYVLLAILREMEKRQYNLRHTPENTIARINLDFNRNKK